MRRFLPSEVHPKYGHSIRQSAGPIFELLSRYLGDQWSVGDFKGLQAAQAKDPHPANQFLSQLRRSRRRTSENMIPNGVGPLFKAPLP